MQISSKFSIIESYDNCQLSAANKTHVDLISTGLYNLNVIVTPNVFSFRILVTPCENNLGVFVSEGVLLL